MRCAPVLATRSIPLDSKAAASDSRAVTIPTTLPTKLTSGPPELPGGTFGAAPCSAFSEIYLTRFILETAQEKKTIIRPTSKTGIIIAKNTLTIVNPMSFTFCPNVLRIVM